MYMVMRIQTVLYQYTPSPQLTFNVEIVLLIFAPVLCE